MSFKALEGRRVAVWGYGREGRAALTALVRHLPGQGLTLLCSAAEAERVPMALRARLEIVSVPPDAGMLGRFEVIVKSPGISIYRDEIVAARARGTRFTSGTRLWFAEHPGARVIGITGTKGKSTSAALLAHLLRRQGVRTALAGNIGLPLLELDAARADYWVVELSSFQTGDAGPLEVGMLTSLYAEHLDWHGTLERYVADKLKLTEVSRTLFVNATQPRLLDLTREHRRRRLYGHAAGWHTGSGTGGSEIYRAAQQRVAAGVLRAPGHHNALNACGCLAVLEYLGLDVARAVAGLADFQPLPHRLQMLGKRDARVWINDSISTTPQASLAALESLRGQRVCLIVGGYDRGLDWSDFVRAVAHRGRLHVIAQGSNGPRIAQAMRGAGEAAMLSEVDDLDAAIEQARRLSRPGEVILLSPGAPSFDQFDNYAARGRHFADRAGFDGAHLGTIQGLGIADA